MKLTPGEDGPVDLRFSKLLTPTGHQPLIGVMVVRAVFCQKKERAVWAEGNEVSRVEEQGKGTGAVLGYSRETEPRGYIEIYKKEIYSEGLTR